MGTWKPRKISIPVVVRKLVAQVSGLCKKREKRAYDALTDTFARCSVPDDRIHACR